MSKRCSFLLQQAFRFTCKNSQTTKAALTYYAALELRTTCQYQLNLAQWGPSSNRDTLDLTTGFTCHSTFSIRHYRELNSRSWGVEHSPRMSLYNIPEMRVHFIPNISALKISMQKVNWQNNFRKAWLFVTHELYLEIPLALNLVGRVVHNANLPTISGPELSILKSQDVPVSKAGTPIRSFHVHFHHLISNFVNASWPQRTLISILALYPQHLLAQLVYQSREVRLRHTKKRSKISIA